MQLFLLQVQCWHTVPCISTRREFSSAPKQNLKPQLTNVPPKSGNSFPKVVFGSVVIGAAVFAAYQTGYLDQLTGGTEQNHSVESTKTVQKSDSDNVHPLVVQKFDSPSGEETEKPDSVGKETESSNPIVESTEHKVETDAHLPHLEASGEEQDGIQFQDSSRIVPHEKTEEENLPEFRQSVSQVENENLESKTSTDENLNMQSAESSTRDGLHDEVQTTPISSKTDAAPIGIDIRIPPQEDTFAEEKLKELNNTSEAIEEPSSLLEAYHLKDEAGMTSLGGGSKDETNKFVKETEALIAEIEELNDGYISKDGKLVIDFLQAIHAAEKRQAELDYRVFADEKRALKEKMEKELRDARVRELMHAEEAAILDKELKRERTKAAAALKSLQEKLEEKFQKELEQKENEVESKLRKLQDMAKAELAAAIASEKAAQMEKMAEANLHINALCMAFYARSEEARQSHSAQKLALGALALEDALSRGLPIQAEIEALRVNLQGIDKDLNLELILSSIPKEILNHGSDTLLQMTQKFDALKAPLRHLSLIPPGGGGILAHSLARVASWIKVKEADQSGNGIESIINRVESYLAEGNLAEAAHSLEEGVKGTKAEEVVHDWVRQARNRAITEQALTLLQLYASSISLT
ncbi:kinesin-like protein KIF15 isoform X1 [Benincasa hispida]|uniref:kinesin-like protein KIF15 isoform X1 n=1 Tax=Benincasa hispida TaxID=102211 RepID=UPI001901DA75|nr:kinesin-like protein KIF15 isoform X1 [Benincasa hispida]XP_038882924.1 kinesin-like protein KIF15 isoform X1 [Benincasa hispida]